MINRVKLEKISGFKIGHAQNYDAKTGCTVILCEDGAIAGFDLRGSAPGTRETEILRPGFLIEKVHGIFLTGGSSFGLDGAGGVQRFLEERGKGYDVRGIRVPIVPAAVIFDLQIGDSRIRPQQQMAYQACEAARDDQIDVGLVGVGTGATVGKILGKKFAMPGGIGYASERLDSGLIVSALVVVNALGDVFDPDSGEILAGAKDRTGKFINTAGFIRKKPVASPLLAENTTLGVVMTNGDFNKVEINKVAQMAQNGLARAIKPVHTMFDGDLIFSLCSGEIRAQVTVIGEMAKDCVSRAITEAVKISNKQ